MTRPMAAALDLTKQELEILAAAVAGLRQQCLGLSAQAREGSKTQENAVLVIGHCLRIERAIAGAIAATDEGQAEPPNQG